MRKMRPGTAACRASMARRCSDMSPGVPFTGSHLDDQGRILCSGPNRFRMSACQPQGCMRLEEVQHSESRCAGHILGAAFRVLVSATGRQPECCTARRSFCCCSC